MQGIDAKLMPLDKRAVPDFVLPEEEDHGPRYWVGCNGDWMAFVHHDGTLTIRNVYTAVILTLPSLQDVGISPSCARWPPGKPFL